LQLGLLFRFESIQYVCVTRGGYDISTSEIDMDFSEADLALRFPGGDAHRHDLRRNHAEVTAATFMSFFYVRPGDFSNALPDEHVTRRTAAVRMRPNGSGSNQPEGRRTTQGS
jgi:hypothetical protein